MATTDPKTYLWQNIAALMGEDSPSIDAVQKKVGVGRGTVQRIKEAETSVGLDKLVSIAKAFKLQVWQLLTPGLDPKALPVLGDSSVQLQATPETAEAMEAALLLDSTDDKQLQDQVLLAMHRMIHLRQVPKWPRVEASPYETPKLTKPTATPSRSK